MLSADGEISVVFDGAIHNVRPLRRKLEAAGCNFKSQTDTEILIHGYKEWGIDCLAEKIEGMFAIGICELIKKIAEHFKNGSVVLIGKIAVDAEQKVKILSDVENVHFLGRKPYWELPNYCKGFDVALNPFAISELTLAANPLKVREYLAAGLPVISTDIPEVAILTHCRIGKTHEDFIRQIEEALKNPRPQKAISDSVKNESWEARDDELRGIMKARI